MDEKRSTYVWQGAVLDGPDSRNVTWKEEKKEEKCCASWMWMDGYLQRKVNMFGLLLQFSSDSWKRNKWKYTDAASAVFGISLFKLQTLYYIFISSVQSWMLNAEMVLVLNREDKSMDKRTNMHESTRRNSICLSQDFPNGNVTFIWVNSTNRHQSANPPPLFPPSTQLQMYARIWTQLVLNLTHDEIWMIA